MEQMDTFVDSQSERNGHDEAWKHWLLTRGIRKMTQQMKNGQKECAKMCLVPTRLQCA